MNATYKTTMHACFIGYVVQAIVNNLAPLLFTTFQASYGIPLSQITILITVNFGVQLLVDLASAAFIDKIGYRRAIVAAHIFAVIGLISLAILPDLFPNPFVGFLLAVMLYAIGGGLIEVLISPITEACPTDNKERAMSLLHSFYCWGQVTVIVLSTVFFTCFGITNWKILSILWAIIPLFNVFLFLKAPMGTLLKDGERSLSLRQLCAQPIFWLLLLMMLGAGASEQAVSQWASTLAETALGISKTLGDLAGPTAFAILMGISRALYGKYGDKINLERFMSLSAILCILSYLCISLTNIPVLALIGCALCGLSVGILWPGTFSRAAVSLKGGTAMFALLALAGDLGCSAGPAVVGTVSSLAANNLKRGILAAIVFPVLFLLALFFTRHTKRASTLQDPSK